MTPDKRTRPLLADVVRADLRRAIMSGEFPLGSKLPNEEQLRERFEVSRITLREAVRGLIEDGMVVRRHGSGTYVTHRPALRNSLDTNFSYTEYLESSGRRASKQVLSARVVPADHETAKALRIEVDADVVEIRRVRTADQRPAIYSEDYIPADIVDAEADRDSFRDSLYRLLAERRHPVEHGEAILMPVVADRELAQLLHVTVGTPLQHLEQVDVDQQGRPVMWSLEWHVPSVIELRVYRRGPGPSGH
ncbi:GntR family transcriptional regulator [Microtetraspora sp. AC03309]|uniref:GntR family transcriptional regulator n=1 Tax=Microtetraspora sp. AC03309 TaxID=2779376 RepID=UPI001E547F80|nr:GntR family transcriptional regulator [Microtetraspora sp. AC03309]MCC5577496.1 GntR family transcriptional regulator [Microtetraspora sp. AC03309]